MSLRQAGKKSSLAHRRCSSELARHLPCPIPDVWAMHKSDIGALHPPPGSSSYFTVPLSSHANDEFSLTCIYPHNLQCINSSSFIFLQKCSYIFFSQAVICGMIPIKFSSTSGHMMFVCLYGVYSTHAILEYLVTRRKGGTTEPESVWVTLQNPPKLSVPSSSY